MIWDENMPGSNIDKRAVVECDKPGCPESYYIPGTDAIGGAARMKKLGWEISTPVSGIVDNFITYPSRLGIPARCPEHAQGEVNGAA